MSDEMMRPKFIVLHGGMFRRFETLYDSLQCVNENGGRIYEPLAADAARQVGVIEEHEKNVARLESLVDRLRAENFDLAVDKKFQCTKLELQNERLRVEIQNVRTAALFQVQSIERVLGITSEGRKEE